MLIEQIIEFEWRGLDSGGFRGGDGGDASPPPA